MIDNGVVFKDCFLLTNIQTPLNSRPMKSDRVFETPKRTYRDYEHDVGDSYYEHFKVLLYLFGKRWPDDADRQSILDLNTKLI